MTPSSISALLGRSLRKRAMVACALVALAEEEFYAGQRDRASETMRTIRTILTDAWIVVSGDVSSVSLSDLRESAELLADLNLRIIAMEEAMRSETIH